MASTPAHETYTALTDGELIREEASQGARQHDEQDIEAHPSPPGLIVCVSVSVCVSCLRLLVGV